MPGMDGLDNWLTTDTVGEANQERYEAWVDTLPEMPDGWFDTEQAETEYLRWCEQQDAVLDVMYRKAFGDGPNDDQIRRDEWETEG